MIRKPQVIEIVGAEGKLVICVKLIVVIILNFISVIERASHDRISHAVVDFGKIVTLATRLLESGFDLTGT